MTIFKLLSKLTDLIRWTYICLIYGPLTSIQLCRAWPVRRPQDLLDWIALPEAGIEALKDALIGGRR